MPSSPSTPTAPSRPRVALICHHDAPLHFDGVARWLASWAELTGVVVVREPDDLKWKRVKRERRRVGLLRLADVFAFRAYYRLTLAATDDAWKQGRLEELRRRFPGDAGESAPRMETRSPNSAEAEAFLREARADIVLALCKNILKESVFTIPTHGTFVCHPGICPEYRNAHGCFWALANDDVTRVGMTLLRIDRGIDTGPMLGYFTYPFDEVAESHIVIQNRVFLDNLDAVAATLSRVMVSEPVPIPAANRSSREWGQPWLTRYLRWKRHARRRAKSAVRIPVVHR
jgi:hypothetical protein